MFSCLLSFFSFFFFKQKTAYEMLLCDWSSDVCSSDLDGTIRMMVQGLERVRIKDWTQTEPYLVARIEQAPDEVLEGTEVEALRQAVVDVFSRLVAVSTDLPDELPMAARNLPDPRHVVYFIASVSPL